MLLFNLKVPDQTEVPPSAFSAAALFWEHSVSGERALPAL